MYGKTIFSWNVPAISYGTPMEFANLLVNNKFEGVCLKAGDGPYVFHVSKNSPWPTWGENVRDELVDELKRKGLKVYFWHFLYGYDPSGELRIAKQQVARFQPDGYIWDVEGAFDNKYNAVNNARLISGGLKTAYPNLDQALCWWALPKSPTTGVQWHPIKVAEAFLETVDLAMPMEYWQGSTPDNAVNYLNKSVKIWRSFTDVPLAPIGRCYNGDGGIAESEAITRFAQVVYNYADINNFLGCSWWSFDKAVTNAAWLNALSTIPPFWYKKPLSDKEILDRLMKAHKELFPEVQF